MGALAAAFEERLSEIEIYLDFLQEIETATTRGAPRLEGSAIRISVSQTRILYSSVYLQLYNLVEATVTRCVDELTETSFIEGLWRLQDVSAKLRREWVRFMAGSHKDLNHENRLNQAVQMTEHLLESLPIRPFKLEKSGGNLDDKGIEAIAGRIGLEMRISARARRAVKETYRDDRGAMGVVVSLRNQLAHGSISFVECGESDSVAELRQLKERMATYMREVVAAFEKFIDEHEYIRGERRPLRA